jgi:long-chain acyl-CoA synthetase
VLATAADDTALIIYTSGTTGKPKGAELSHFQLFLNCTIAAETFGVQADDVSLAALPFFHIYGLSSVINCAIRNGSTLAILSRFEPQAALDVAAAHMVSVLAGVPTMYHALWLADVGDRDLSRLRLASCGGSSMPEALLRGFEEKFGVVILEGYGLSETGSTATMNHSVQERRIGSIGKPIWGVEARLVDPRDRCRLRRRRDRRDLAARAHRHEGLLRQSRGDRGGDPGRLVAHGRPRPPRR